MCEISDQLRLCTCAITDLENLKDYWVLYRPDGGNNVLVGMTKLPANFYISQNESNEKMLLYRLDKQYSPISAIASLYYLFDTIGIYHCKIYKILAYYINHIGITFIV